MKGSECKFAKYMEGSDKRFVILVYQRNYDWKTENCKQLYDDLVKIIKGHRESHFFGSLVSVYNPDGHNEENLLTKGGLDYIEIVVSPWAFPVNYDGEYHYRSGSTKQMLRGNALTNFLMSKTGLKWDAATISNIGVDDLDQESFDIFRREALQSG